MKTPNDPKKYEQEYYRDVDGNVHYVERTTESEKPNSYQNGYTHGRAAERSYQNNLSQRDSENTARGLLIGVILASLAALGGAYAWYRSQPEASQQTESPVVTPEPVKTQPSPVPEQKTTIIERVKEVPVEKVKEVPVLVPVPQSNTPDTSAPASNSTSNQSTTKPESTQSQSESTNIVPTPEENTNSESNSDNNNSN
ncbi:hypothetical protein [Chroococcus sp. FPU101]|uniref:hypothetical protein n=1 Tax=Chroococcus sp. FPU101 TaxID=1974212 RepID=UPI001A90038B|nr:hypothetical protein [Chroococcus sp. FPU101]GFE67405.1 hypothetical protein CFPU101_00150 [Chroococcus sp. FPU101]